METPLSADRFRKIWFEEFRLNELYAADDAIDFLTEVLSAIRYDDGTDPTRYLKMVSGVDGGQAFIFTWAISFGLMEMTNNRNSLKLTPKGQIILEFLESDASNDVF